MEVWYKAKLGLIISPDMKSGSRLEPTRISWFMSRFWGRGNSCIIVAGYHQTPFFWHWSIWFLPIGSMFGIFTYIYHKNQPNVGIYMPCMDPMVLWIILTTNKRRPRLGGGSVEVFFFTLLPRGLGNGDDFQLDDCACFANGLKPPTTQEIQVHQTACPWVVGNPWSMDHPSRPATLFVLLHFLGLEDAFLYLKQIYILQAFFSTETSANLASFPNTSWPTPVAPRQPCFFQWAMIPARRIGDWLYYRSCVGIIS